MKLADLTPRVVRLLDYRQRDETDEERRQRRYQYTVKWRANNREKRNQNDAKWRQRANADRENGTEQAPSEG